MHEVIKAVEEAIIREASIKANDMKGLADLVNSYSNLVKVAAGTTTDITLVAEEVVRRLVEAGRSAEEANEIVKSKSKSELAFILACDEIAKESNQDRQD
ncbi:hypothetical protein CSV75_04630 [Sporosarcina sp. P18a]|uniref:hypothetical protein n=1 Tax=Sporosarcina sp. P18a TaxID=2048259 RepID=UPI000C16C942|nr:hypothetical protein [Sporosarcina sp. P18a]PIC81069.1 hypothetical protein CSV75_04630 [Sporosarcina sp. P18a]